MPSKTPGYWDYALPAALLLMAPFDILASLGMDIYLPVVPMMSGVLHTRPAVVQLSLTLYMIALGLGQIVFGPLSDRIGRRPVLIGGVLLFASTSLLLATTSSAAAFITLRLLQGLGASAMLVATFATVRDVYATRPEGSFIYGLFGAMLAFVPALGPIAGALLADRFGWRAVFIALAVLASAALLNAWPRWLETRPSGGPIAWTFRPILGSFAFWTYTFGFSAAMGAFFVFFSTAPGVLIGRAGFTKTGFSLAFATAALVMILTTRATKRLVLRWGIPGSLVRGMAMLLLGAVLLSAGQILAAPSFWTFIVPMWVVAVGVVFAGSVTANGALQEFGHIAGTAVALYYCVESLIVGGLGTLLVVGLPGDTAWPLVAYCAVTALATLAALKALQRRQRGRPTT